MEFLGDLGQWNILVGFLFPLVMGLIKQSGWSHKTNAILSAVVAAVAAFVTTAAAGDLTAANWAESFILVFTVAVAAYNGLWKPTGAEPAIKDATSFVKAEG